MQQHLTRRRPGAAVGRTGIVPVRDSKNPHGPKLVFRASSWSDSRSPTRSTSPSAPKGSRTSPTEPRERPRAAPPGSRGAALGT
ncbi:DUF397 domain-containing protein [Streptomyces sp. CA-135486]|uniref:DUF397 domain-containing protein n=1 Tax=Streptomyces sp. CA-135486 TaxID=3240049 RepID=UPI003D919C51